MNRSDSRKIAETITNQQLAEMFQNAKNQISNWNVRSIVNKGISKGVAWNVLAKDFDVNHNYHLLAKANMIREFGEFLPKELVPSKKRKSLGNFIHHEPIFKNNEQ